MSQFGEFNEQDLNTIRRAYARQILTLAGVAENARLESAFASEPRERYLGPGPWKTRGALGNLIVTHDPVLAYGDIVFALLPDKQINNGSPLLHAHWLHHADLKSGERVVHLGAGTGYYTALLAHMVGPSGIVIAVEYDESLAERARANLSHLQNVEVVRGDGMTWPHEGADCIYVNFAVQKPAEAWLDRLASSGRLIFPLGVPDIDGEGNLSRFTAKGAGLRVERRRGDNAFGVQWLGPAYFICADGQKRDATVSEADRQALFAAFEKGGIESVRSLRWRQVPGPDQTWFAGTDWSLSFDPAS